MASSKKDHERLLVLNQVEIGKCQRVIPVINEMLQRKGLVKVAEGKIFVTGLKGPLEPNWQKEVEAFASRIPISP